MCIAASFEIRLPNFTIDEDVESFFCRKRQELFRTRNHKVLCLFLTKNSPFIYPQNYLALFRTMRFNIGRERTFVRSWGIWRCRNAPSARITWKNKRNVWNTCIYSMRGIVRLRGSTSFLENRIENIWQKIALSTIYCRKLLRFLSSI